MEDMIALYLFKIKELILQYIRNFTFLPTNHWAVFLAYGIPFTLFYVARKALPKPSDITDLQKKALDTIWGAYWLISLFIVPMTVFSTIDCAVVFLLRGDVTMLLAGVGISLYSTVLYKILFMLMTFKRNAVLLMKLFSITLPFSLVFYEYALYPFNDLLQKERLPFDTRPDYLACFIGGCFLAVPLYLCFTFSKRIKAAWADTGRADHAARLGTDGPRG